MYNRHDNQRQGQGPYGTNLGHDPQMGTSNMGLTFNPNGASASANPLSSLPIFSQQMSYRPEPGRAAADSDWDLTTDLSLAQGPSQRDDLYSPFISSHSGLSSSAQPPPRSSDRDCSIDGSLSWLRDIPRSTSAEPQSSSFPSSSSSFPFGGDSIPGLGDYPDMSSPQQQSDLSPLKYGAETATNILRHFNLEKEDLEQLLSVPENEMTPEKLPLILRQIRIEKTRKAAAESTSSYKDPSPVRPGFDSSSGANSKQSKAIDHGHKNLPGTAMDCAKDISLPKQNPVLPSKVIDYGHTGKRITGAGTETGTMGVISRTIQGIMKIDTGFTRESIPLTTATATASTPSTCISHWTPIAQEQISSVTSLSSFSSTSMISFSLKKQSKVCSLPQLPAEHQTKLGQLPKVPHLHIVPIYVPVAAPMPANLIPTDEQSVAAPELQDPPSPTLKGLPPAAMVQDYAGATPSSFPHTCSLCDKECSHMKDWISHQTHQLHVANGILMRQTYPDWDGVASDRGSTRRRSPSPSPRRHHDLEWRDRSRFQRHTRRSHSASPPSSSHRLRSRSKSRERHRVCPQRPEEHRRDDRRTSPKRKDDCRQSSRRAEDRCSPGRPDWHMSPKRTEEKQSRYSPRRSRERRHSPRSPPRPRPRYSPLQYSPSRSMPPRERAQREKQRSLSQSSRETRSPSDNRSPKRASTERRKHSDLEQATKSVPEKSSELKSVSDSVDTESLVETMMPLLVSRVVKEMGSSTAPSTATKTKVENKTVSKPTPPRSSTMVLLASIDSSLTHSDVVQFAEQFGKTKSVLLFRHRRQAVLCFEREEDARNLRNKASVEIKEHAVTIVKNKQEAVSTTQRKESPESTEKRPLKSDAKVTSTTTSASGTTPAQASTSKATTSATTNYTVKSVSLESRKEKPDGGKKQNPTKKVPVPSSAETVGERLDQLLTFTALKCHVMDPDLVCGHKHVRKFLHLDKRLLLLTELPENDPGQHYSEEELVETLQLFQYQHEPNNLYVLPQCRMAFVAMPDTFATQKLVKSCVKENYYMKATFRDHPFKACVLNDGIFIPMTPFRFYVSLMQLCKYKCEDDGENTVFITNISDGDAAELRQKLKKIGAVKNYVPLLNKVFVEFETSRDVDRLGVYYSRTRTTPSYEIQRMKVPRSKGALQTPGIPVGSRSPFWVTLSFRPFLFPTQSPWFSIPDFEMVKLSEQNTTVMLTGLPEDGYTQLQVFDLTLPYGHKHCINYQVIVLPLQRRAFVSFLTAAACAEFVQRSLRFKPTLNGAALEVHYVNSKLFPVSNEEEVYSTFMTLSNNRAPVGHLLERRLLCVFVAEVSLDLIRLVMEVVTSVAPVLGFLPLGNRICIELPDVSAMAEVKEKLSSYEPELFSEEQLWCKVLSVETSVEFKERLRNQGNTVDLPPAPTSSETPAQEEAESSKEEPDPEPPSEERAGLNPVELEPEKPESPTSPPRPPTLGETLDKLFTLDFLKFFTLSHDDIFGPTFLQTDRDLVALYNMPEYDPQDPYTEEELVEKLTPFGFVNKPNSVYIVPQCRMAFVTMPDNQSILHLMTAFVRKPRAHAVFRGRLLVPHVCIIKISRDPWTFYCWLMAICKNVYNCNGERTVFISNIKRNTTELRRKLEKFGHVTNFLPLLNQAFVEFATNADADRLGVHHSFLKRTPLYDVTRMVPPTFKHNPPSPSQVLRAMPDASERAPGVTAPKASCGIPPKSKSPFWVTMTSSPFLYATDSPWFNIPKFETVQLKPNKGEGFRVMNRGTIMLTNLPYSHYTQEAIAKLMWPYLQSKNLHCFYYDIIVLPLQRRAFINFDAENCAQFVERFFRIGLWLKKSVLQPHYIDHKLFPLSSEEEMYTTFMSLGNSRAPERHLLEHRLLCVFVYKYSIHLVRLVMEVVTSAAPVLGFLPLANRICIELPKVSDVAKVKQRCYTYKPEDDEQLQLWRLVLSLETSAELKLRVQRSGSKVVRIHIHRGQMSSKVGAFHIHMGKADPKDASSSGFSGESPKPSTSTFFGSRSSEAGLKNPSHSSFPPKNSDFPYPCSTSFCSQFCAKEIESAKSGHMGTGNSFSKWRNEQTKSRESSSFVASNTGNEKTQETQEFLEAVEEQNDSKGTTEYGREISESNQVLDSVEAETLGEEEVPVCESVQALDGATEVQTKGDSIDEKLSKTKEDPNQDKDASRSERATESAWSLEPETTSKRKREEDDAGTQEVCSKTAKTDNQGVEQDTFEILDSIADQTATEDVQEAEDVSNYEKPVEKDEFKVTDEIEPKKSEATSTKSEGNKKSPDGKERTPRQSETLAKHEPTDSAVEEEVVDFKAEDLVEKEPTKEEILTQRCSTRGKSDERDDILHTKQDMSARSTTERSSRSGKTDSSSDEKSLKDDSRHEVRDSQEKVVDKTSIDLKENAIDLDPGTCETLDSQSNNTPARKSQELKTRDSKERDSVEKVQTRSTRQTRSSQRDHTSDSVPKANTPTRRGRTPARETRQEKSEKPGKKCLPKVDIQEAIKERDMSEAAILEPEKTERRTTRSTRSGKVCLGEEMSTKQQTRRQSRRLEARQECNSESPMEKDEKVLSKTGKITESEKSGILKLEVMESKEQEQPSQVAAKRRGRPRKQPRKSASKSADVSADSQSTEDGKESEIEQDKMETVLAKQEMGKSEIVAKNKDDCEECGDVIDETMEESEDLASKHSQPSEELKCASEVGQKEDKIENVEEAKDATEFKEKVNGNNDLGKPEGDNTEEGNTEVPKPLEDQTTLKDITEDVEFAKKDDVQFTDSADGQATNTDTKSVSEIPKMTEGISEISSPRSQTGKTCELETKQESDTSLADSCVDGDGNDQNTHELTVDRCEVQVMVQEEEGMGGKEEEFRAEGAVLKKDVPEPHPLVQEDHLELAKPESLETPDEAAKDEVAAVEEMEDPESSKSVKRKHEEETEEIQSIVEEEEFLKSQSPGQKRGRKTPVRESTCGRKAAQNNEVPEEGQMELVEGEVQPSMSADPEERRKDAAPSVEFLPETKSRTEAARGPSVELGVETNLEVGSKQRTDVEGPDSKRSRSESPSVPSDTKLPPFRPNNPLGQDHLVPKRGFCCDLCGVYLNESTAQEKHCSSRRHYNNLQKYLEGQSQSAAQS